MPKSHRNNNGWRRSALRHRVFWSQSLHIRYAIGLCSGGMSHLTPSLATKIPLFKQEIDTGLTWSARNRQNPARFQDYIPTSTVPTQLGQFLTKKQQLEAAKARADAVQPEHNSNLPLDEGSGKENNPVTRQITTDPDPFGIFRKYSSLSSHNPDDVDPFTDISPVPPGSQPPATTSIGSNLTTSCDDFDPLSPPSPRRSYPITPKTDQLQPTLLYLIFLIRLSYQRQTRR